MWVIEYIGGFVDVGIWGLVLMGLVFLFENYLIKYRKILKMRLL